MSAVFSLIFFLIFSHLMVKVTLEYPSLHPVSEKYFLKMCLIAFLRYLYYIVHYICIYFTLKHLAFIAQSGLSPFVAVTQQCTSCGINKINLISSKLFFLFLA